MPEGTASCPESSALVPCVGCGGASAEVHVCSTPRSGPFPKLDLSRDVHMRRCSSMLNVTCLHAVCVSGMPQCDSRPVWPLPSVDFCSDGFGLLCVWGPGMSGSVLSSPVATIFWMIGRVTEFIGQLVRSSSLFLLSQVVSPSSHGPATFGFCPPGARRGGACPISRSQFGITLFLSRALRANSCRAFGQSRFMGHHPANRHSFMRWPLRLHLKQTISSCRLRFLSGVNPAG